MAHWVLAPEAQSDLQGIRRYTEGKWGIQQARKYRTQLQTCIERFAAEPDRGKDLGSVRSGLRSIRCQHHVVFCLFGTGHPPLVVAIFHEKMDLMARISERLG